MANELPDLELRPDFIIPGALTLRVDGITQSTVTVGIRRPCTSSTCSASGT